MSASTSRPENSQGLAGRCRSLAAEHPGMALAFITGAFALLQLFIWAVVLELFWYGENIITDTDVYYEYASNIMRGQFPYRDFEAEYPPVAMLIFLLPRLVSGTGYNEYVVAFEAEMLLVSWGILALMSYVSWRQWGSLKKTAGVLTAYTFFLLALGTIVKSRFDLAAALLILACLAAWLADRRFAAWALLGVGAMTKVVPLLLAPLFLIAHLRRRQRQELWMGPLVMLLSALIIATPFLLASPGGLAKSFLYHAERPLQLESSWSSPLLLLYSYSDYLVEIRDSYGSHNVFSPDAELLATLSGPVALALLGAAYLIYWRRCRTGEEDRDWPGFWLVRFGAAAVAIFIFSGKVFSPQFLIWLMPLIPLARGRDWPVINGLFAAALLMTQWEFPFRYWDLYMLEPALVVETAARNLVVGLLALLLVAAPGWRGRAKAGG